MRFLLYICILLPFTLSYVTDRENYKRWRLVEISGLKANEIQKLERSLDELPTAVPLGISEGIMAAVISPKFNLQSIENKNMRIEIKSLDFGRDIAHENRKYRRSIQEDNFFSKYRTYSEMLNFLSMLENKFPEELQKEVIGNSYEGRPIYLYTITKMNQSHVNCTVVPKFLESPNFAESNPGTINNLIRTLANSNSTHNFFYLTNLLNKLKSSVPGIDKPIIFIDAGSHSREWVSPAATLYLMHKLLHKPELIDEIEWKIVPMVNPDGYIHTWQHNRLWRKTRSKNNGSLCSGADLNRNYDFHFGEVDTSTNPCREHYGGSKAFSEAESRAIKNAVESLSPRIKAYLTIHNWGQEIMYPMSYSKEVVPKNEDDLKIVGDAMSDAITKRAGVKYRTGRASISLYPSSGTVSDWAYAKQNIPLTYTLEMRDTGKEKFFLSPSLIQPTGEDLHAATDVLARILHRETLIQNNCVI